MFKYIFQYNKFYGYYVHFYQLILIKINRLTHEFFLLFNSLLHSLSLPRNGLCNILDFLFIFPAYKAMGHIPEAALRERCKERESVCAVLQVILKAKAQGLTKTFNM